MSGARGPAAREGEAPPGEGMNPARPLWAMFSLFVVYLTTIPFSFDLGSLDVAARLQRVNWHPLGVRYGAFPTGDIVQNILLFMPFGFLGYVSLVDKRSPVKLALIVLLGADLSALVEFLQIFTYTRWSALSDVIFNTLGTAAGVAVAHRMRGWVAGIRVRADYRRIFDAPSAFPALVFAGLAVVGILVPFDFGIAELAWRQELSALRASFLRLDRPDDELLIFIRFLLASLFACRLAGELGARRPILSVAAVLGLGAVVIEAAQLIIKSRDPSFQDAATALLGVCAGAIASLFPGFREHPRKWGALAAAGVLASAAMTALHPFRFADAHAGFHWIPFMSEYADTNFAALTNFIETSLAWFPLGFLLGYFFPGSRRPAALSLVLTVALSFGVEIAQGLVAGRSAHITDVIGAAMGCLAGSLVLTRGWTLFREAVSDPR